MASSEKTAIYVHCAVHSSTIQILFFDRSFCVLITEGIDEHLLASIHNGTEEVSMINVNKRKNV